MLVCSHARMCVCVHVSASFIWHEQEALNPLPILQQVSVLQTLKPSAKGWRLKSRMLSINLKLWTIRPKYKALNKKHTQNLTEIRIPSANRFASLECEASSAWVRQARRMTQSHAASCEASDSDGLGLRATDRKNNLNPINPIATIAPIKPEFRLLELGLLYWWL